MTGIAIPPLGNYAIAFAASVECMGIEPWTCAGTTPEMLQLGLEAAPESACLPFKSHTGHFLLAARQGVEYGVMVNSVGTCRLRYYRALQQKILDKRGAGMYIFGLGYDGFKPPLIRHFDPDMIPFLRCSARAMMKTKTIDKIELKAWKYRAREQKNGDTTGVMNACLRDLDAAHTVGEISRLKKTVAGRFRAIAIDEGKRPLKVALVGETSVLRDKYLNHNIEEILGSLDVEVFNFFLLGAAMRNIFHIGLWNRYSKKRMVRLARPYLKCLVGGHALDSVAHTIRCAREGFDGVVHLGPTGCMPEISIRPILRRISSDYNIPILECSFDEHTSHVGFVTRIEAFVDLLLEKRKARSA